VKTDQTLTVPLVETSRAHTITEYSAIAGGVVRDDGGSEISSYGICWDTVQNPSIEGMHKAFSDGTGPFFTSIKNLELRTIYYVKAYAINSTGLAYGNEVVFRTNDTPVTDIDGNTLGAIYSWSAAVNGQDSINPELEPIQGVCPDGWHLPSDGDWKELEMFLGMTALSADSTGWRGNIGGKLKSTA
jgi:hypothetical protein